MNAMHRPDPRVITRHLKDFQRASVEYITRRFFDDEDRVDRFLLADEVGLGKTKVAQGVVAHAVDRLWDQVKRIDVVYVCSNATIARQNINRLRLGREDEFASPSRLTLLPIHAKGLEQQKVNFVSFTPATSFEFSSATGVKAERMLLYHLLQEAWGLRGTAPQNLLQGDVEPSRWRRGLDQFGRDHVTGPREDRLDESLRDQYLQELAKQPALRSEFEALLPEFAYSRQQWPKELRSRRNKLVAALRRALARTCIAALQPDLVILDEFQRFKHLLTPAKGEEGESEVAELAQDLFNYRAPEGHRAKVLLLSATPYRMFTLDQEDEDHYQDFLATMRFLLDSSQETSALSDRLYRYRDALCAGASPEAVRDVKLEIERRLRRVMCRTERLAVSADRNGMVSERATRAATILPGDLSAWRSLARIGQAVEAGDAIDLWKSAPYLLNLMDDHYDLKRRLKKGLDREDPRLAAALRAARHTLLDGAAIGAFQPIEAGNARVRALLDRTVTNGAWKLLWLPPALPYTQPGGPFAEPALASLTKTLVFSSWQVVPKAIAALVSYEAERRMVAAAGTQPTYAGLRKEVAAPLRFARTEGRLTGMSVLPLVYPCATLARRIDPLALAASRGPGLPTAASLLEIVRQEVEGLLQPIVGSASRSGQVDEAWYWAAPILLDRLHEPASMAWLNAEGNELSWETVTGEAEEESRFADHVAEARRASSGPPPLGPPPPDLAEVLARMALGSPAVCLLRALGRQWPARRARPSLLAAAARGAMGFRSLFNRPETVTLLRGLDAAEPYWRRCLDYAIDGNLQATLDEYVHALRDHLGLRARARKDAGEVGAQVERTVSLSAVSLAFDAFEFPEGESPRPRRQTIRCRHALRFGQGTEEAVEGEGETRDDAVRDAFNSPFRPFVLASTSVGQEGLDFHLYCHAIVHWNLPANPVDLEQREGRIHRFKGHMVRRNVAAGGLAVAARGGDPWVRLFEAAEARKRGDTELEPYWLCDGAHRIERHVPMLPLSRDVAHFDELKQAMALYRLVFGQPRQEDLMRLLASREAQGEAVGEFRIELTPGASVTKSGTSHEASAGGRP